MHKAGVILLIIGALLGVIGAIGLVVGVSGASGLADYQPRASAVLSVSGSEAPKTATFQPGDHQVWVVQGTARPTVTIADENGTNIFSPLAPGTSVQVNGYDKVGSFVPEAGKEYTVTVEQTQSGEIYVTRWDEEELLKSAAGTGIGILVGCCSGGAGGLLMILGVILGLSMKKK